MNIRLVLLVSALNLSAQAATVPLKGYWSGPFVYSSVPQKIKTNFSTPIPAKEWASSRDKVLASYLENLKRMKLAHFMIADLTPFRGMSADTGTAFSMGFMFGLGKPVFAYSNDSRVFSERISQDLASRKLKPVTTRDGRLRDDKGDSIETFDMADNLMLAGAVETSQILGGAPPQRKRPIPNSFEGALATSTNLLKSHELKFNPCSLQNPPQLTRIIPGRKKALLNGPDVFRPEAILLGLGMNTFVDQFKDTSGQNPFTGIFPFDVAVSRAATDSEFQFGTKIFLKDMTNLCVTDVSLANITPYRGVAMDVGTAFELGFLAALGKPAYGYSFSTQDYAQRTAEYFREKGKDRYVIPQGLNDDIMIEGTLQNMGFGVASNLEGALKNAAH